MGNLEYSTWEFKVVERLRFVKHVASQTYCMFNGNELHISFREDVFAIDVTCAD